MAYKQVLERNKDKVIGLVLDGLSDAAVAAAMSNKRVAVTRQAVTQFRRRHAEEIAPAKQEMVRQASDYAISSKVYRMAGLQMLADKVLNHIEERGLLELSEIETADGTNITRERFAREVSAELRAIFKDAANEMDDLPRGTTSVNIDNRTQVLVHEIRGIEAELG